MSQLNMILESEICVNLLSALLHSLWQGLIIAGILLLYLKSKKAQDANTRYTVSLIALSSILVCLFFTWSILNYEPARTTEENTVIIESPVQIDIASNEPQNNPKVITNSEIKNASTSINWKPPVIGLWLIGVLIMLFRAIYIIAGGAKLQFQCKILDDEHILKIVEHLRSNLKVTQKIRVAISEHISVPGVVGFFTPLLLLPVSIITGMPDEALQAILAHELAHIRRYDYFVNFCQMVIEAILFFNPAVWWISRQIRIEREVCCDNAGIASIGRRIRYAEVLIGWAQKMKERDMESVEMAIGFDKQNDSGLPERIKRIVSTEHRPGLKVSWHIAMITLFLSIAMLAALCQGTNMTVAFAGNLSTKTSRTVHFPKEFSIGELFIQNWDFPKDAYGAGIWKYLGYAQGDVIVPEDKALRLDVSDNAWQNGNPFAGLEPDDIQMLSFDKYKDADDSALKDVSNLGGLQVLNLSGTQINGTGFRYLGKFKNISVLLLAATYINENELEALTDMPSLEHINFNYTHIGNEGMVYIGKIKTIKSLVLSGTSVDDDGLKHLQNLHSIRYLRFINNKITDEGMKYLGGFPELEDLILQFTPISNAGLAHLSKLNKLKNLNIVGTKINDDGLKYLKELKSLEYIDLPDDTHISDEGLSYLSEIKSLRKLFLTSDSITAKGLESLSKLPSLEEFDTGGSTEIDDTFIEKIAEFPALKCLWIQNCQVTDEGLAKLKKLKTLKTLKIANSPVTCDGLSVLKEFPGLTELELFNLYKGDAGLSALEGLTSLESLKVYSMQVTDNDLANLISLTNLKTLYIDPQSDIKKIEITDKGMQYLGKIKSLRSLLINKADITNEGLFYLEELSSLTYLGVHDTKVTEEGLIQLKKKIPSLEYHI